MNESEESNVGQRAAPGEEYIYKRLGPHRTAKTRQAAAVRVELADKDVLSEQKSKDGNNLFIRSIHFQLLLVAKKAKEFTD